MKIDVTKDELSLIYNALLSHAARLSDYADEYRRHGDAVNSIECINEAYKCRELSRKFM